MTKTPVFPPSISDLFEEFFAGYQPGARAAVRARIATVRADLERHLELEGPRILTTGQRAILASEKQFNPAGAFARTMHADDLYYALQHYLHPAHTLDGPALRETQLDVVAAIAASVWSRRLVSDRNVSECTIIEFDIAMKRARVIVAESRARDHGVTR